MHAGRHYHALGARDRGPWNATVLWRVDADRARDDRMGNGSPERGGHIRFMSLVISGSYTEMGTLSIHRQYMTGVRPRARPRIQAWAWMRGKRMHHAGRRPGGSGGIGMITRPLLELGRHIFFLLLTGIHIHIHIIHLHFSVSGKPRRLPSPIPPRTPTPAPTTPSRRLNPLPCASRGAGVCLYDCPRVERWAEAVASKGGRGNARATTLSRAREGGGRIQSFLSIRMHARMIQQNTWS